MTFAREPAFQHGSPAHIGVLLINLGTPDAPTPSALRRYLAEFLSDPRVVEIPRLLWLMILHGIILRIRPARSAAKYASIWQPEGSPLAVWTRKQQQHLQTQLEHMGLVVHTAYAMRYGNPSLPFVLDQFKKHGIEKILFLPLYPQYASATTGSVIDVVMKWTAQQRRIPEMRFINHYHDHPAYIQALAESVRQHWSTHGTSERLLLSFHGVPERSLHLGDPYHCECHKTARLLTQALALNPNQVQVTFQSRFGKAKWLGPYTEPTLVEWAQSGVKSVDVMCPGFTSDCLETLEEINIEAREAFLHAGGQHFQYIPCLNDSPPWITALGQIAQQHLQGWGADAESIQALHQNRLQQRQRAITMGASK
jgi:ferrochelatase